jgi:outer membrane protein OmpA-like peptidoglycan-associated protein
MKLILLIAILFSPVIGRAQTASPAALESGTILDIKSIRFAENSASLHDSTEPSLQKIVSVMSTMKETNWKIQGSALFVERDPEALALQRAEAVKKALIKLGVDPARLQTSVFIDNSLKLPTLSLSELAELRRVEFIVVERK